MSLDVLQEASPRRLLHVEGRWVLEIESLVPITRSIFRPTLARVEGTDAILLHLTGSPNGKDFLQPTTQLFQLVRADEDKAYEAVHGRWMPTGAAISAVDVADITKLQARLGDLDRKLVDAVSERERLASTVAQLEAQLAQAKAALAKAARGMAPGASLLPTAPRPSAAPQRAVARSAAPASTAPDDADADAIQAAELGELPGEPSPAELEAIAALGTVEGGDARGFSQDPMASEIMQMFSGGGLDAPDVAAAEPEAPSGPPAMQMPDVTRVRDTLSKTLGESVPCEEVGRGADIDPTAPGHYVSEISDDEGRVLGAIVVDATAAVQLGGKLLALEPADLDAQVQSGTPSADALDGTGEVCNMLKSVVQGVTGGAHVSLDTLKSVADAEANWIARPAARMDLKVYDGRLLFLANFAAA